jgi:hypothetical protein
MDMESVAQVPMQIQLHMKLGLMLCIIVISDSLRTR